MANEEKKDFNAMLHDSKDMSKFQTIADEKSIGKDGGERMYFAKQSGADFTEPIRRESLVPLPHGQASERGRQDALLADAEGKWGAE